MQEVNYTLLNEQLESLFKGENNVIAMLSNASAVLFYGINNINWAGFYLIEEGSLILGPFQGKPACMHIPIGKGVCGTAVAENKTKLVKDVHQFPGHIACDSASNSEIVIPMHDKLGNIVGVLDIDSEEKSRFTEEDKAGLEKIVKIIENFCF